MHGRGPSNLNLGILDCSFWCLPGFITIPLYQICANGTYVSLRLHQSGNLLAPFKSAWNFSMTSRLEYRSKQNTDTSTRWVFVDHMQQQPQRQEKCWKTKSSTSAGTMALHVYFLVNLRKTIKYTAVAYFFFTFLELNALWKNLAAGSISRQTSG